MDTNVIITIKSLEYDGYNGTPGTEIETIQPGIYKYIHGRHIIIYEEPCDDTIQNPSLFTKNLVKISSDSVSITRRGQTCADMFFKKDYHYSGTFGTDGGTLSIPIDIITSDLNIKENTGCIDIQLSYSLELSHDYISMHTIYINIHFLENTKKQ